MDCRPWLPKSTIASLEPDQRNALLAAGRLRDFAAGEVLVRQGETSRHVRRWRGR